MVEMMFCFFCNIGMEESNEVRPLVPVTEEEPPGHIALEKEQAAVERRPPRNGYKNVPLTYGCHQSVMPAYRLPGSFSDIPAGDERGLLRRCEQREVVQNVLRQPWILGFDRSVVGFEKGDGEIATLEDTANDAKAWSVAFARDVRGVFCQNHDHNCAATCSKYSKSTPDVGGSSNRKKDRSTCLLSFSLRSGGGTQGAGQSQKALASWKGVGAEGVCLQDQCTQ